MGRLIDAVSLARGAGEAVLAALRDSGRFAGSLAVEFSGPAPGVVHLRAGRLVQVDAAGVPDLRTRLVHSTAEPTVGSSAAPDEDLQISVLLDGALAVLGAARTVPQLRMRPDAVARPVDPGFAGLPLPHVLEIVAERRVRLAEAEVDPDVPLRPALPGHPVRIDAGAWEVAARIDGARTPRDIAWLAGLELYSTQLAVARLVAEGACVTPRIAPPPEFAADLTRHVDVGPELIERLIDGIRRLP